MRLEPPRHAPDDEQKLIVLCCLDICRIPEASYDPSSAAPRA